MPTLKELNLFFEIIIHAIWFLVIIPLLCMSAYNRGKSKVYGLWAESSRKNAEFLQDIISTSAKNEAIRQAQELEE